MASPESHLPERSTESGQAAKQKPERLTKGQWQLRLLPVMIGGVVVSLLSFLVFSLVQTNYVRARLEYGTPLQLAPALTAIACNDNTMSVAERQECARWKVLAVLEAHVIERRYHQANAALLVRAWIKYIGFLTGMMISVVGSVFILGRLTEAASKLSAEGTFGKLNFESVSPGLILVLLGTVLMITTVLVNPPTDVSDAPVYLTERPSVPSSPTPP